VTKPFSRLIVVGRKQSFPLATPPPMSPGTVLMDGTDDILPPQIKFKAFFPQVEFSKGEG